MSFESLYIKPDHAQPDTDGIVGVYVPGIDAGINNTGNRVQEMANQAGMPILMTDLLPQGKPSVDEMHGLPTRLVNLPFGDMYAKVSRKRTEYVWDALHAHGHDGDKVILMGDSLGVPVAQGMQLHADIADSFGALLVRDGWNLGRSDSAMLGRLKYIEYQAANIVHDLARKIKGTGLVVPNHGWEKAQDWPREYGLVGMVKDATDLMRGFESRTNAIHLTRQAALGRLSLNVACLRQGLSGTATQQDMFVDELRSVYIQSEQTDNVRFHAESVNGWHSDLLDPARGAQDIKSTLQLIP